MGEGANLGVTQAARIAFAAKGGRINTDIIDNSAGVDRSEVEVNIKIALNREMAEGRLSQDDRDALLVRMTDDVAALVLEDNRLQVLRAVDRRKGRARRGAVAGADHGDVRGIGPARPQGRRAGGER